MSRQWHGINSNAQLKLQWQIREKNEIFQQRSSILFMCIEIFNLHKYAAWMSTNNVKKNQRI